MQNSDYYHVVGGPESANGSTTTNAHTFTYPITTPCPNCHYCPTCGRGSHYPNYEPYRWVSPYGPTTDPYFGTPIYPWQQYQTWC